MIPGLVFAGLGLGSYLSARSRQQKFEKTLASPQEAEGHHHTAYNRRQARYSIAIIAAGLATALYGAASG